MQAIGARANCPHRVDLPFPQPGAGVIVFADNCPCGGPWVIVEEGTDIPARTPNIGEFWVMGKGEDRRSYGEPRKVSWSEPHHGIKAILDYCHRNGYTFPWATRATVGAVPWETMGDSDQAEFSFRNQEE